MDINILLLDEVSIILLWVGLHGLLDQLLNSENIFPIRNYIYIIFVLFALYLKLN
jgi:hypothetical protein